MKEKSQKMGNVCTHNNSGVYPLLFHYLKTVTHQKVILGIMGMTHP
jgi:hypothetical protein